RAWTSSIASMRGLEESVHGACEKRQRITKKGGGDELGSDAGGTGFSSRIEAPRGRGQSEELLVLVGATGTARRAHVGRARRVRRLLGPGSGAVRAREFEQELGHVAAHVRILAGDPGDLLDGVQDR